MNHTRHHRSLLGVLGLVDPSSLELEVQATHLETELNQVLLESLRHL
jgi:hypothetical protein